MAFDIWHFQLSSSSVVARSQRWLNQIPMHHRWLRQNNNQPRPWLFLRNCKPNAVLIPRERANNPFQMRFYGNESQERVTEYLWSESERTCGTCDRSNASAIRSSTGLPFLHSDKPLRPLSAREVIAQVEIETKPRLLIAASWCDCLETSSRCVYSRLCFHNNQDLSVSGLKFGF